MQPYNILIDMRARRKASPTRLWNRYFTRLGWLIVAILLAVAVFAVYKIGMALVAMPGV